MGLQNLQDEDGHSAFMVTCRSNVAKDDLNNIIAKLLIAQVDMLDKYGRSSLIWVCLWRWNETSMHRAAQFPVGQWHSGYSAG